MQLRWSIHKKDLYVIVNYLKTWQHYFKTHKKKKIMNNVSIKYFETQSKATTKQL
jgi:hypothetical protein